MSPLFIFCFKCLKKVPEIPGSTCFNKSVSIKVSGGLGKGNKSIGLVFHIYNKPYKIM